MHVTTKLMLRILTVLSVCWCALFPGERAFFSSLCEHGRTGCCGAMHAELDMTVIMNHKIIRTLLCGRKTGACHMSRCICRHTPCFRANVGNKTSENVRTW